jgi:hypothetical protein
VSEERGGSVLILTGPPGAGKTTIARLLCGTYDRAVHVESDLFFRSITSGYVEPWKSESHEQHQVVMRVVGDASATYATAGYFTIIDGIVVRGWFFEPPQRSAQGTIVRGLAPRLAPTAVGVHRSGEFENSCSAETARGGGAVVGWL